MYTMADIFSGNTTVYPTIIQASSQQEENVNLLIDKDKVSDTVRLLWNWVISLLQNWLDNIPNDGRQTLVDSYTDSKEVTLNTIWPIIENKTEMSWWVNTLDYYQDITSDPNRKYINTLASNDIIMKNKKFYPWNDVKLFDFVKMLVNSYRYKLWYDLATDVWFTTDNNIFIPWLDQKANKIVNTASNMWLLNNISVWWTGKDLQFGAPINDQIAINILSNFASEYPNLIDVSSIKLIPNDTFIINRSSLARYIVLAFEIDPNLDDQPVVENIQTPVVNEQTSQINYYFDDTKTSKYGIAVEELAKRWVIVNKTRSFGVENNTTRKDFALMFIKSYLVKHNKVIPNDSYITTKIVDLENDADAQYVVYWEDNNMLDFLFESKRGKTYFYPSKLLTKHEAYHIVKEQLWINIVYSEEEADKQMISRGELAQLLVDSFQFIENISSTINTANSNDSLLSSLWKLLLSQ